MVGSIKSNVGHSEVASGFLSILKTLIALDSQIIPPNANFSEVNEDIRAFYAKQMQVMIFIYFSNKNEDHCKHSMKKEMIQNESL